MPANPLTSPPVTLTEITKALEAAVASVSVKRAGLDAARAKVKDAEVDYQGVVDTIRALHAQYQTIMGDILSFGGTVHK